MAWPRAGGSEGQVGRRVVAHGTAPLEGSHRPLGAGVATPARRRARHRPLGTPVRAAPHGLAQRRRGTGEHRGADPDARWISLVGHRGWPLPVRRRSLRAHRDSRRTDLARHEHHGTAHHAVRRPGDRLPLWRPERVPGPSTAAVHRGRWPARRERVGIHPGRRRRSLGGLHRRRGPPAGRGLANHAPRRRDVAVPHPRARCGGQRLGHCEDWCLRVAEGRNGLPQGRGGTAPVPVLVAGPGWPGLGCRLPTAATRTPGAPRHGLSRFARSRAGSPASYRRPALVRHRWWAVGSHGRGPRAHHVASRTRWQPHRRGLHRRTRPHGRVLQLPRGPGGQRLARHRWRPASIHRGQRPAHRSRQRRWRRGRCARRRGRCLGDQQLGWSLQGGCLRAVVPAHRAACVAPASRSRRRGLDRLTQWSVEDRRPPRSDRDPAARHRR